MMSARLSMIEKMLAQGSRDPFVWYAKAMELRVLGRIQEALEAYQSVIREFPDYVPAYLMAAQVALEVNADEIAKGLLQTGRAIAIEQADQHAASEMDALFSARLGSPNP